tara:strand:- start:58 stop:801 length:744 start_codon:yes stop_codon:yes gene_type:complete
MIKFFRKIRHKLLTENKFSKYLIYAIGEIVLVVIGILIALQINNNNELRKEKETANILAFSLIQDLQKDVEFLKDGINFSDQKIDNCALLQTSLSTTIDELNKSEFYKSLSIVGQSNPFFPTNGTYEQMKSSGTLKYFDQSLINKLNAYDMHTNKTLYWTDVEDKTLWLMAEVLWTGINIQALGEIRFNQSIEQEQFIKIKNEEIDEFTNYVAAVKTYRQKILIEYKQQFEMANDIIRTLKSEYKVN